MRRRPLLFVVLVALFDCISASRHLNSLISLRPGFKELQSKFNEKEARKNFITSVARKHQISIKDLKIDDKEKEAKDKSKTKDVKGKSLKDFKTFKAKDFKTQGGRSNKLSKEKEKVASSEEKKSGSSSKLVSGNTKKMNSITYKFLFGDRSTDPGSELNTTEPGEESKDGEGVEEGEGTKGRGKEVGGGADDLAKSTNNNARVFSSNQVAAAYNAAWESGGNDQHSGGSVQLHVLRRAAFLAIDLIDIRCPSQLPAFMQDKYVRVFFSSAPGSMEHIAHAASHIGARGARRLMQDGPEARNPKLGNESLPSSSPHTLARKRPISGNITAPVQSNHKVIKTTSLTVSDIEDKDKSSTHKSSSSSPVLSKTSEGDVTTADVLKLLLEAMKEVTEERKKVEESEAEDGTRAATAEEVLRKVLKRVEPKMRGEEVTEIEARNKPTSAHVLAPLAASAGTTKAVLETAKNLLEPPLTEPKESSSASEESEETSEVSLGEAAPMLREPSEVSEAPAQNKTAEAARGSQTPSAGLGVNGAPRVKSAEAKESEVKLETSLEKKGEGAKNSGKSEEVLPFDPEREIDKLGLAKAQLEGTPKPSGAGQETEVSKQVKENVVIEAGEAAKLHKTDGTNKEIDESEDDTNVNISGGDSMSRNGSLTVSKTTNAQVTDIFEDLSAIDNKLKAMESTLDLKNETSAEASKKEISDADLYETRNSTTLAQNASIVENSAENGVNSDVSINLEGKTQVHNKSDYAATGEKKKDADFSKTNEESISQPAELTKEAMSSVDVHNDVLQTGVKIKEVRGFEKDMIVNESNQIENLPKASTKLVTLSYEQYQTDVHKTAIQWADTYCMSATDDQGPLKIASLNHFFMNFYRQE